MRLLGALVVLLALEAHAIDLAGTARVWIGGGLDTNPRRDFTSAGTTTPLDGVLSATGSLSGQLEGEKGRLLGSWDVGGRKFIRLPSEDTLVNSLYGEGALFLGRAFSVGFMGRLRDRRGAERDYTDLGADAFVDFTPDNQVLVRLRGGAHRFVYWPRFPYSFGAPTAGLLARYRFNKRHALQVLGEYEPRRYNGSTNPDPNNPELLATQRTDTAITAGVSYTFRGPFHITGGYTFFTQSSNSFGESVRRHRFNVVAGFKLPFEVTVLATGALQFQTYPDGVFLNPDLIILEDDENLSSVSVKLVRPLGKYFEVDLRYALYTTRLARDDLNYLRQVVQLGVGFRY